MYLSISLGKGLSELMPDDGDDEDESMGLSLDHYQGCDLHTLALADRKSVV